MSRRLVLCLLAGVLAVSAPAGLCAQGYTSLGVGLAAPWGDFGDRYDPGFTLRGETGLSLVLADVHGQVGWTRLRGGGDDIPLADADVYHVGIGSRLGVGLLFVGLNADYFFGDGEHGVGWVPEVGVKFLLVEAVADLRVDGDSKWVAARVGIRF